MNQVTVEEFVDVARFFLAVSSVEQALLGNPSPELQKHFNGADPIIKRVAGTLDAGLDSILRETFSKAKIRNKAALDAALRGSPAAAWNKRAEFMEAHLPRLKSHAPSVRDSFGESANLMRKVIDASEVDSPAARIFTLAEFRTADGQLTRLKKWVEKASELLGNPVSDVDALATDMVAIDQATQKLIKTQAKVAAVDPNDPEAASLKEQAEVLKGTIKKVADQSSDPKAVLARSATQMADNKSGRATRIGDVLGTTPEQEDALTVRGRAVIAAGAGSGKTRVLAGKVLHHIMDLNTPLSSVMAVSFTRKSSKELTHRIAKYAKDAKVSIPDTNDRDSWGGIGTTHSIGRDILKSSGRGYRISSETNKEKDANAPITGSDQSNLVKVAMKQVQMRGVTGGGVFQPEDMSFFPTANKNNPPSASPNDPAVENKSPVTNPTGGPTAFDYYFQEEARFKSLMDAAKDSLNDFLGATFNLSAGQNPRGYWLRLGGPALDRFGEDIAALSLPGGERFRWTPPAKGYAGAFFANRPLTGQPWNVNEVRAYLEGKFGFPQAKAALNAVTSAASKDPSKLTDSEKGVLQDILSNPVVQFGLRARGMSAKTAAFDEDDVSEDGIEVAGKAKDSRVLGNEKGPFFYYAQNPANQWFNLGIPESQFVREGSGGKKKKLTPADFLKYIGLKKNNLVAPGAAYQSKSGMGEAGIGDDNDDSLITGVGPSEEPMFAAVYGAYEWLKRNIPDFRGRVDFDDQLVLSSKELIENPSLLRRYQQRFKCVLVDEAQDLNKAQHTMFGLIAGYLDPANLQPRADGKMSADTFALIGDDKQAIYGFRGADPDEFIDKSDLVPGGKGFKTKLLDTNFRSGSNIVDAANKLIAHNSKQIPMVCKTDPRKGGGSIMRVPVEDLTDASATVADEIEAAFKEAEEGGNTKGFYKQYGIAVRTNREVYGYVMNLIEKGIPFRSKKNPLKGPVVKPVLALFNLRSSNVSDRNQAVIDGTRCPDFGINGGNMAKKLKDAGVTDFYDALVNKGMLTLVYRGGSYLDRLRQYVSYIKQVRALLEKETADSIMSFVLSYKSPDGTTFIDSVCAEAKNDADLMEEVQALADQSESGEVTPELIKNAAMAPLDPLRRAANRFPSALAFNEYIQSLNAANDRTEKNEGDVEADAVQIDTVHGWKGLEVSNLYLAMWQGGFPHARSVIEPELLEAERRLAYVALTRGASNVKILEPRIVQGKDVGPSQFVEEACIPTVSGEDDGKTASLKYADCWIPTRGMTEDGFYTELDTSEDSIPLESVWPDYMVRSEEV